MNKRFKKYFLPHEGNAYKPHFLRAPSIMSLFLMALLVFGCALGQRFLVQNTDMLSAVFPKVLVDLANSDRVQNKLITLTPDPLLEKAAQMKAEDMASKGYFAHTSPDGKTPWYWLTQAGYNFLYAGENLAVNFSDSDKVDEAWMNSPLHRANILNNHYTHVGIALAHGVYKGKETVFVVQMFGSPKETQLVAVTPKKIVTVKSLVISSAKASSSEEVVLGAQSTNFIEFKASTSAPQKAISLPASIEKVMYATTPEKVVTTPGKFIMYIYALLAMLIGMALILFISAKAHMKHPHIVLGALSVLIFLGFLSFVYNSIAIAEVAVH